METGGKCPGGCCHDLAMGFFYPPFFCVVKTSVPVTWLPPGILKFCLYQQCFFFTANSFAIRHGELRDTAVGAEKLFKRQKYHFHSRVCDAKEQEK